MGSTPTSSANTAKAVAKDTRIVMALAKAAGIRGKVSAHSARIGLASKWSASMVRHYSAGVGRRARAVAKYP